MVITVQIGKVHVFSSFISNDYNNDKYNNNEGISNKKEKKKTIQIIMVVKVTVTILVKW